VYIAPSANFLIISSISAGKAGVNVDWCYHITWHSGDILRSINVQQQNLEVIIKMAYVCDVWRHAMILVQLLATTEVFTVKLFQLCKNAQSIVGLVINTRIEAPL